MLVRDNALLRDAVTLGGAPVRLADLRCPFLRVLAERDHIVPEPAVAPLIDLVGSPDRRALRLDAGHVGLLVGRTAAKTTVPQILDFLCERSRAV